MEQDTQRKYHRYTIDSRARAIVPMTIALALNCCNSDNNLIDGQPFDCIVLVGRLIEFSSSQSKFSFTINDDTGIARLVLTTQNGKKPHYLQQFAEEPLNKYVKCVVTPKLTGDKHDQLVFYLNRIQQITDKSAITVHLTQVILRHMQRIRGFSS